MNLIEETGHFHITNTTFDFDLCSLDKTTVRKLQSYLETSGTSWGYNNWMHQKLLGFFFFLVVIFLLLLFIRKHSEWCNQKGKNKNQATFSFIFLWSQSSSLDKGEVKQTSLSGPLFSPRKSPGRVCLDSLENKQIKHNTRKLKECVWYHVSLSVVVHSTGRMRIQHTALLHNWSIYYCIQIPESRWGNDTTRHYKYLVPWMLFQCSALAIPSPVTLLVYRAALHQLFPTPLTRCSLFFHLVFFQF